MPTVALATGRATLAGQVEGDGPDKRGYPGPPGWALSDWPAISSLKKNQHSVKTQQNWRKRIEDKLTWKNLSKLKLTLGCKADQEEEEFVIRKILCNMLRCKRNTSVAAKKANFLKRRGILSALDTWKNQLCTP
jgi:hypothetical protein